LYAAVGGAAIRRPDWDDDLLAAASALAAVSNRRFLGAEAVVLGDRLRALALASPAAREAVDLLLDAAGAVAPRPPGQGAAERPSPPALPRVTVRLLGRPEVLVDGAPPRDRGGGWGRRATRELFYLLEARRAGVAAEAIAERLWPEAAPGRGQALVWKHCHRLRAALSGAGGPVRREVVQLADGVYRLNPGLAVESDAAAFEAAAAAALALRSGAEERSALARADRAYGGAYLEGVEGAWVHGRRRALAELHARVLRRLAQSWLEAGGAREALGPAERLARAEPLGEEAQGLLQAALVGAGEGDRARREQRAFARRTARVLGAPPPDLAAARA
jgi:DNA-binding SARP family transcriptional activator